MNNNSDKQLNNNNDKHKQQNSRELINLISNSKPSNKE
jgi:hypothetical protein